MPPMKPNKSSKPSWPPILHRRRASGQVSYQIAVMIDGKMQDDATWKQAKVIVDLARQVAAKDPLLAERYAL